MKISFLGDLATCWWCNVREGGDMDFIRGKNAITFNVKKCL